MTAETDEQKIKRLEAENKRLRKEKDENLMFGALYGRTLGRTWRMDAATEFSGGYD
jgi:hypothetical protein